MRHLAVFASSVLALAGCYSTSAPPDDEPGPGVTPATEELACAPSELALAWSREDPAGGIYAPARISVAPGGALFATRSYFGGTVARAGDGSLLAHLAVGAFDGAWSRTVEVDAETNVATVRDLASGSVLATIAPTALPEGWYARSQPAISGDGSTAFVIECAEAPATSERSATLIAHRIGGAEQRVPLPVRCVDSWRGVTSLVSSTDGSWVVLAGIFEPGMLDPDGMHPPAHSIVRVDLASGAVLVATPGDPTRVGTIDGTAYIPPEPAGVLDIQLSDDAETIAVATRDGFGRRLDADTLEPIGAPFAVTLAIANHDTYMPSVESPLAISSRGSFVAHVGEGRSLVVRDSSGTALATVALPFADLDGDGLDRGGAPMAIRFVHDGFVVATDRGAVRYACGGTVAAIARPAGELAVRVEGPTTVSHGERVPFIVHVDGATLPVVRFVEMGMMQPQGALGPTIDAWVYADPLPATLEVRVHADDGLRSAMTTTTLRVE